MERRRKRKHTKNTQCEKCKKIYKKNYKVAHPDHINGEFINSLCNECNLKYQYKRFLPVYLNFSYHCNLVELPGFENHRAASITKFICSQEN